MAATQHSVTKLLPKFNSLAWLPDIYLKLDSLLQSFISLMNILLCQTIRQSKSYLSFEAYSLVYINIKTFFTFPINGHFVVGK